MSFLSLCSLTSASEISNRDFFPVMTFSRKELIKGETIGWKTHKGLCREIKKRIKPKIVEIDGKNALYVNAIDSGTITFKPVHLNPEKYPFLSWRWKISNILPESREKEEGRDDYPAAVCIVYGKTIFSIPYKYKILIYVYGNNLNVGERFWNPCEKRARIITVENGNENAGKWLNYTVNHYQDYVQEFGQKPPEIIYIGIQTNADRNHGKVESWYSDIALHKSQ